MKMKEQLPKGIIDIHSHILPGVDDGPQDLEESVRLLRMAWEQGISYMIATPHYVSGELEYEEGRLERIRDIVQEEAWKIDLDIQVYGGNELYYSESILEDLRKGKALTLAGSRYILVEFSPVVPYGQLYQGVKSLINGGYFLILAHVERYECLVKRMDRMQEIQKLGCYFQMNFCSLHGGMFDGRGRACRKLVLDGWIQFLATDAHGMLSRSPDIADALQWLAGHCDRKYMEDLLVHNPMNIINNKIL